jgi:hypothetical protein
MVSALEGHPDKNRVHRAMAHFREAARAMVPLNQVMSAEHLFMACENLG